MIATLALAALAAPQTVLQDFSSQVATSNGGQDVAVLDDLTGDGVPEIVLGTAGLRIQVLSGADSSLVSSIEPPAQGGFTFGNHVDAFPDLDGDGHLDVLTGAHGFGFSPAQGGGVVLVHSSATGQELLRIEGTQGLQRLGWSTAPFPDLDGDGVDDILAGAPGPSMDVGAVHVLSGASGAVLRVHSDAGTTNLGGAVSALDDVDGDGVADIVAAGFEGFAPRIVALSGDSGALLWSDSRSSVPPSLAALPDVDGDGVGDVAAAWSSETAPGAIGAGVVRAYSGATGAVLWERPGTVDLQRVGADLALVDDLDGDGLDDLAGTATFFGFETQTNTGLVQAFSSATGEVLLTHSGDRWDAFRGIARAWDSDGDGTDEILLGRPYRVGIAGSSFVGGALLLAHDPALGGETVCVGAPNSIGAGATLTGSSASGFSIAANDFALDATGLPPRASAILLTSRERTAPVAIPGTSGALCLGGERIGRDVRTIHRSAPNGTLRIPIDLAAIPRNGDYTAHGLPGDHWVFQLWYRDVLPGGADTSNLSDAWRVTLQP